MLFEDDEQRLRRGGQGDANDGTAAWLERRGIEDAVAVEVCGDAFTTCRPAERKQEKCAAGRAEEMSRGAHWRIGRYLVSGAILGSGRSQFQDGVRFRCLYATGTEPLISWAVCGHRDLSWP